MDVIIIGIGSTGVGADIVTHKMYHLTIELHNLLSSVIWS